MNEHSQDKILGVGPKSRQMLMAAGICSRSQLVEIGSAAAFVKVKRSGCTPSLNFLWGLESVITGEHWREIAKSHRLSLILAVEQLETRG